MRAKISIRNYLRRAPCRDVISIEFSHMLDKDIKMGGLTIRKAPRHVEIKNLLDVIR